MPNTATNETKTITVCDGWSRDPDAVLRLDYFHAWALFGALKHDHNHAPSYAFALGLKEVKKDDHFEDFLADNNIETYREQGASA